MTDPRLRYENLDALTDADLEDLERIADEGDCVFRVGIFGV